MSIYAWTTDNSFFASGPSSFTTAELNELVPGQVLVENNTGQESDPLNKTVSLQAFDALDCTQYG